MKTITTTLAIALVSSIAMVNVATAATSTGSIKFTGSISAESCHVESPLGDAIIIQVPMGTVNTTQIGSVSAPIFTPGSTGYTEFQVVCKNDAMVNMTLNGSASELDATNSILRVNNGVTSAGYAQNVGVALYPSINSSSAYDLKTSKLLDNVQIAANESVFVKFSAAYVKNGADEPTAGQANATLPFILEMN